MLLLLRIVVSKKHDTLLVYEYNHIANNVTPFIPEGLGRHVMPLYNVHTLFTNGAVGSLLHA